MLAPICLFTYNRLSETKQTIEALQNNYLAGESELFIFSDGPKDESDKQKVLGVRNYLKTVTGFHSITIFESERNKGLANSIISGVTKIINQYGKVIVLEDDLITAPNFLDFMNSSLCYYEKDSQIQSINGFSLKLDLFDTKSDIYFQQRPFPWGWGTWKQYWELIIFNKESIKTLINNKKILRQFNQCCGDDMGRMLRNTINGKINSWYVMWCFNHFINKTYSVFPVTSKVTNMGFTERGTHTHGINSYVSIIDQKNTKFFHFINFVKPSGLQTKQFLNYFSYSYKLFFRLKCLFKSDRRKDLFKEIYFRFFK